MGESTLTTLKERIISFLSFTVYLLFHNLAASYVPSLCVLQVNATPHIDGNLAVILQMKKTDVLKSPRQERYSRLQFWCRITYIEISGFTKFQVQDWLFQCNFAWQNHGLNLALPSLVVLYQHKYWPFAVNTTNTALSWTTKICSTKKEDMLQTQVKKAIFQGSRLPQTQRNDIDPMSTCTSVDGRMAAAATQEAATKFMIQSCFSQTGPGFPILQTQ